MEFKSGPKNIEQQRKEIEMRRQQELQGPGILYHGTGSKNEVLSGKYDANKGFASAGQAAGAGLYVTSRKDRASNYAEQAITRQKEKSQPVGKAEVLYFNKKDFNIIGEEIGPKIAQKAHELFPAIEGLTEHSSGKDLFEKLVYELYGQPFQSNMATNEVVDEMVKIGVDGRKLFDRDGESHYILYNFDKIKNKEVNEKYDNELAIIDPDHAIVKRIVDKF